MNQFRKCESTTSGECGSTGRPGTIRPGLGSGLQIGAPAGARQHLESLRLLLAIGQRRDRIIIEPVLPIALDIADTSLACPPADLDRKSTRLNSSHLGISYAVFCLKKKT